MTYRIATNFADQRDIHPTKFETKEEAIDEIKRHLKLEGDPEKMQKLFNSGVVKVFMETALLDTDGTPLQYNDGEII